jgi:hypothetical protein
MKLLHRAYGATPLHLLAHLGALSLAAYAVLQLVGVGRADNVLLWFVGAVVLHDFLLLPFYSGLDRAGRRLAGSSRRFAVNYVRVAPGPVGAAGARVLPGDLREDRGRVPQRQRRVAGGATSVAGCSRAWRSSPDPPCCTRGGLAAQMRTRPLDDGADRRLRAALGLPRGGARRARRSIDWWCVPRFDSPSVFGRLLDPDAGHWALHPEDHFAGRARLRRRHARPAHGVHD